MSEKTINFFIVLILGTAGIGLNQKIAMSKRPDLIRLRLSDIWTDEKLFKIIEKIIF